MQQNLCIGIFLSEGQVTAQFKLPYRIASHSHATHRIVLGEADGARVGMVTGAGCGGGCGGNGVGMGVCVGIGDAGKTVVPRDAEFAS